MTNKQHPALFDWATELLDAEGHVTLSAKEAHEIGARLRSMGEKLKTYEDLDEAASDVQLLRIGYAAARLEIESLQARIKTMAEEHADELMVAHLDGRMRAEQAIPGVQWQCGPQANGFTAPQADSVTAPASGANWQDISTAPKDGTRFVAVGQNYGLDSEKQHTCIAQWLAGCWVEVSDWNGASKLKYLTHWMPLPPLPGSAARAPADSVTAPAVGYPPLPRVGAIGYASVVDIQSYAKTLTIGPHLPGVRDIALWTTDQMSAYVDADRAARASHGQAPAQAATVCGSPADLPPLPDPDLRDVGTTPGGIKEFLRGYATEYAKAALAARAWLEGKSLAAAIHKLKEDT